MDSQLIPVGVERLDWLYSSFEHVDYGHCKALEMMIEKCTN